MKPDAAGADGIGHAGIAAKRADVGAGLLARSPPRFCRFFLCRLSDSYASPTSRRLSLLFDKLPKELPSGVYAPPLVTLDLDFSAIRKEGVWIWIWPTRAPASTRYSSSNYKH
jgi:hypothetical protein